MAWDEMKIIFIEIKVFIHHDCWPDEINSLNQGIRSLELLMNFPLVQLFKIFPPNLILVRLQ